MQRQVVWRLVSMACSLIAITLHMDIAILGVQNLSFDSGGHASSREDTWVPEPGIWATFGEEFEIPF